MAYVARPSSFQDHIQPYPPTVTADSQQKAPSQPGLLRRAFDAIMESRQRRVQRDIERFVGPYRRRLTDSLEREINDRMYSHGWNIHR